VQAYNLQGSGFVAGTTKGARITQTLELNPLGGLVYVGAGGINSSGNIYSSSSIKTGGSLELKNSLMSIGYLGSRMTSYDTDSIKLRGNTSDNNCQIINRSSIMFFAAYNADWDSPAAGFAIDYDAGGNRLYVKKKAANGSWTPAAWNSAGYFA